VSATDRRRDAINEAWRVCRSRDKIAITRLLDSPEPTARSFASNAIMRQRIEEAVPQLRSHLEHESDAEARSSMALALAELAMPESKETFLRLLTDPDHANRRMALRGLSLIGDESVSRSAVEEYRAPTGPHGRQEALDALARLRSPELPQLLADEKSWRWRRRIRRALRAAPVRRHS
jgi:HEAT repeat protein